MSALPLVSLASQIATGNCEILNASPASAGALAAALGDSPPSENSSVFLSSDDSSDAELIIHINFRQTVKLRALKILTRPTEESSGPRNIRLFVNQPTLSFADVSSSPASDQFSLSDDQIQGNSFVMLKFVKYQAVQCLTIFIESNQSDSPQTRLDWLGIFGDSLEILDVAKIKKQEE